MTKRHSQASGFTIVEVIVVIVLASVIFVSMATSSSSIFGISEGSSQRYIASNLAYSNMRIYADGRTPSWFACDTADETAPVTLLDKTESVDRLPGEVAQLVTVTAPYGCDGPTKGYPLHVISTVTLINGIKVTHATYTTF